MLLLFFYDTKVQFWFSMTFTFIHLTSMTHLRCNVWTIFYLIVNKLINTNSCVACDTCIQSTSEHYYSVIHVTHNLLSAGGMNKVLWYPMIFLRKSIAIKLTQHD